MNRRKTLGSILFVTISNISTIISGVFVGFLLPKMVSLDGYGYYKVFTLYCSYIGLFTLGLHDGIVLKYGGTNYEEFDKKKFRSYFKWYLLINACFSLIILAISQFALQGDYRIIFFLLSINIMANSITGYFQQISQITQRFTEYSVRKIVTSIINIASIALLYIFYKNGNEILYLYYVFVFVFINIIMTVWYIFTYREIVFGDSYSIKETKKDAKALIENGFPLTIANLCSSLILTLDRQFVSLLFPTATYAIYAFAYNILSLVTVATSAISAVLYPLLKRTDETNLKNSYSIIVSILLALVGVAMVAYFPLREIIHFILPKYNDSIEIFRIIFPGLGISTVITVAMHNYYKTLGRNIVYFKRSIFILVLSFLANCIAYFIFRTTISISVASIITMIIWYIVVENEFVISFNYKRGKNFCFLILYMVGFYIISAMKNSIVGSIIYGCFIMLLIGTFYHKEFSAILKLQQCNEDFQKEYLFKRLERTVMKVLWIGKPGERYRNG